MEEQLITQIREAIEQRVAHPLLELGWQDLYLMALERADPFARLFAGQLAQDEDDRLSAQTVIDCAGVLWDLEPPLEWWATPLGRAVARSVGHPSAESVSRSVAGAMLGVSPARAQQLVEGGKLERHPDGGITTASVRARLAMLRT